ncbi:hypothetical protein NDU88_006623 [Pleurodeles waltl]|uniref:Uncharacterized protein n=1 Tax=Pleurodeles waltl TaxID=8319 RepID=A0AAV7MZS1_PLEWA|nr:hypothetical protein NDU88_006623 [Pleurodeles waltl]
MASPTVAPSREEVQQECQTVVDLMASISSTEDSPSPLLVENDSRASDSDPGRNTAEDPSSVLPVVTPWTSADITEDNRYFTNMTAA